MFFSSSIKLCNRRSVGVVSFLVNILSYSRWFNINVHEVGAICWKVVGIFCGHRCLYIVRTNFQNISILRANERPFGNVYFNSSYSVRLLPRRKTKCQHLSLETFMV